MRPKERIHIFLEKMNTTKTLNVYFPDMEEKSIEELSDRVFSSLGLIEKTWYENPDWRFSQVLVNLGIIPNIPGFWYYMEDEQVLIEQGVPARECILWGNNYDKDMNRLPKTIWRPIKDMKTDHIQNILDGKWTGNPLYTKTFKEELLLRQQNDATTKET